MLSKEEIENNKREILALLNGLEREGKEKVIRFLEENEFYTMPSSLSRHHNWEGGLAQHCLGVYDRLKKTGSNLPEESVIITSLLHDICKVNKIYRDKEKGWIEKRDDELSIPGHGNRSVKLLENMGFKLTPEEKSAIRWHMGGWKIGERPKDEIRDFFATKKSDLWRLLHNADRYDASHAKDFSEKV